MLKVMQEETEPREPFLWLCPRICCCFTFCSFLPLAYFTQEALLDREQTPTGLPWVEVGLCAPNAIMLRTPRIQFALEMDKRVIEISSWCKQLEQLACGPCIKALMALPTYGSTPALCHHVTAWHLGRKQTVNKCVLCAARLFAFLLL